MNLLFAEDIVNMLSWKDTGDGSKPLKKSAGYSKTGRDMV